MITTPETIAQEHDIVLELRDIHHWYGALKVLYQVNLQIVRGEIVALVGPSGCGKSTLLHAILGTHPPSRGLTLMNGRSYDHPNRDRGIVYQRYALFPFLTAEQNVAFGPMLDRTDIYHRLGMFWTWNRTQQQIVAEAMELLNQVGLSHAVHLYPNQMSGGMRQRVAIAQALIMKPQILLLDEPFGALDEATREELQGMLLQLYQMNLAAKREGQPPPYTILLVTHELNEALYVADRVVGLSQYWNWETEGLRNPGATIVYDRVAPVFHPEDQREFGQFIQQRRELRDVVFEPPEPFSPQTYRRFWQECADGQGAGIMAGETS